MTQTATRETKQQLLDRAKEAGIDVPEDATKAQIEALLEKQMQQLVEQGNAQTATRETNDEPSEDEAEVTDEPVAGERREIVETTPRGDWVDPFSGQLIYYGDQISPISGAVREDDEAVLPGE